MFMDSVPDSHHRTDSASLWCTNIRVCDGRSEPV